MIPNVQGRDNEAFTFLPHPDPGNIIVRAPHYPLSIGSNPLHQVLCRNTLPEKDVQT